MTAPHDLDRQLDAFLQDGPTELPDPSFDAVRDHIEVTRQRVVLGPWRVPDMNKFVPIGVGAAAVVLVAIVGIQLLGPSGPGGVGAAPSAEPSVAAPSPSVVSPSPSAGNPFVLSSTNHPQPGGIASTVTIVAPGWDGEPSGGVLVKSEGPEGAAMIGPWYEPLYVYGDPCRWSTTTPETPATTVDEIVAALSSQASREASAPVDVTLDGYPGKQITLHVPGDLESPKEGEFTACDQGRFASWGTDDEPGPARYHQIAGQIDEVWIVDIDGQAAVIDGMYASDTPAETVAEMRAIVESIDLQP
jgi:hypothetical protein